MRWNVKYFHMGKMIQKLNNLNNPESFIQVNTIRGFKYVDKAGELVNIYHRNNTAPQFTMGLDGLVMNDPKEKIEQLKVTSQEVWIKFAKPDSLDMISSIFSKEIHLILKVLEVEKVSRIGWRNYFVYEFQNREKQDIYMKKIVPVKGAQLSILRFKVDTGKSFNANLGFQPIEKNDDIKTPCILFDIDIFQNGEIEIKDIPTMLKNFRQYLADDHGFLSVINGTFE